MAGLKRCFKCGTSKPRTEFYRHPQMADGLLGKCKDCAKTDVLARRKEDIDRVRAYDRERAKTPKARARIGRIARAWAQRHPDRRRAQSLLQQAVKRGEVVPAARCQVCNLPNRLEGHHVDYSHPLAVLWLCKPCHATADKVRRLTANAISILPF